MLYKQLSPALAVCELVHFRMLYVNILSSIISSVLVLTAGQAGRGCPDAFVSRVACGQSFPVDTRMLRKHNLRAIASTLIAMASILVVMASTLLL